MTDNNKMPRLALTAGAAMVLLLASCQGRTTDNMVPKGETVEVVVAPAADKAEASDSLTNNNDTIQNEN